MNWQELNIRDRAQLIKLGVNAGLRNLQDIKNEVNRFDEGGDVEDSLQKETIYSAGNVVNGIYSGNVREEKLEEPSHHYDVAQSVEWALAHGFLPDERGHFDDRVKKPAHPSHPSRGAFKSIYQYELSDKGMEDPNYTLFGLNDKGQDPQATLTYKGAVVMPEITVTPRGNYYYNPYDNIRIYKGDSQTPTKQGHSSQTVAQTLIEHPWRSNKFGGGGDTQGEDLNTRMDTYLDKLNSQYRSMESLTSDPVANPMGATPDYINTQVGMPTFNLRGVTVTANRKAGTPKVSDEEFERRNYDYTTDSKWGEDNKRANSYFATHPNIGVTERELVDSMHKGQSAAAEGLFNAMDIANYPIRMMDGAARGYTPIDALYKGRTWGQLASDWFDIQNPYGRMAMEFTNPISWPTASRASERFLNGVYSRIPKKYQHTYDVAADMANPRKWPAIVRERAAGNYPITKAEVLQNYRNMIASIRRGYSWNVDFMHNNPMWKTILRDNPRLEESILNTFNNTKLYKGFDYDSKFPEILGSTGFLDLDVGSIGYKITQPRSNFRSMGLDTPGGTSGESLVSVGAHEGNHVLQEAARELPNAQLHGLYTESSYNPEIEYWDVSPLYLQDEDLLPLHKNLRLGVERSAWSHSPDEVWSDWAGYRAERGIPYQEQYSQDITDDFARRFSQKHELSNRNMKKVLGWGINHKRAYGGPLIESPYGDNL